jgi:aldose 1-epimerase
VKTILRNKESGFQVELWQNHEFNYIQVYTPPSRTSISIEPHSGAPDAFDNNIGLTILDSEEKMSAAYGIRIS